MYAKAHDKRRNSELSRRDLLKTAAVGFLAALTPRLFAGTAFAATPVKVLTVYYSHTGNTRAVAEHVRARLGGDIVELQTVHPYPDAYHALTEQAKRELQTGFKPPLKTRVPHFGSYDVVAVGSPCWWGTVAAPVITFLSEYDFSGKTIAPFMTHEGSGLGRTVAHIRELCPKATVLEGLAVRGSAAARAQGAVAAWLAAIGLKEGA